LWLRSKIGVLFGNHERNTIMEGVFTSFGKFSLNAETRNVAEWEIHHIYVQGEQL
jgi:hypothetical protein